MKIEECETRSNPNAERSGELEEFATIRVGCHAEDHELQVDIAEGTDGSVILNVVSFKGGGQAKFKIAQDFSGVDLSVWPSDER